MTLDHSCPHCGRPNDSAAPTEPGPTPRAGDASICWGCRKVSIFTDTGLRVPTPEEDEDLQSDARIAQALHTLFVAPGPRTAAAMMWRKRSI